MASCYLRAAGGRGGVTSFYPDRGVGWRASCYSDKAGGRDGGRASCYPDMTVRRGALNAALLYQIALCPHLSILELSE